MKTLNTDQVKQMLDENEDVEIINVLPEDSYREKHIPGTPNIPVGDENFVQEVERRIGGRNRKVVVYCASAQCTASPKAAKKLEEAGFTNVFDYEDGVQGWEQAGLPLESGTVGSRR